MLNRRWLGVAVALQCGLLLSCGSSSKPGSGSQSGFRFTSPTSSPSVDVGGSATLTVSAAAMWSLQSGNGLSKPVGTLSNTTSASASVTYSVPSTVNLSASTQDIVVATSAADSTTSAHLAVVVNQAPFFQDPLSNYLTRNADCSYDFGNNDGTVGSAYVTGSANTGTLVVSGGTAPFTWSATGTMPAGLVLQPSTLCNGNPGNCAILFGTPTGSSCSQITVQATDATGASATSGTYNVLITPAPLKLQVPNYTDLYTRVAYPPQSFAVAGGTQPYSWAVADPVNNPLPGGTNLTVASGTGSAYLSGSPSVTSALTPTLQVTDSQTPYPAIGRATLNFTEWPALPDPCTAPVGYSANNAALSGSYAFMLRGFDGTGPVVMAGSITLDGNGNITAGVEDVMRTTGAESAAAIDPAKSSYILFPQIHESGTFETRGCATLATSSGTTTLAFSVGGCSVAPGNFGFCGTDAQGHQGVFTTGRVIVLDSTAQLSGVFRQQDTSAFGSGLNGPYAFGLSGRDSANLRYAAAGFFNAGSSASVAADINDAGTFQSALTGGTISSNKADTNGRLTATLSAGTASLNLAGYVVSGKDVLLVSTGTLSSGNPIVSGEAVGSSASFSNTTLQNSHIFHVAGLSSSGPDASVGSLSFDGVGSFTGTQYENQANTLATTPLSGVYEVDAASGRFSLNTQNISLHPIVGYAIPAASTLTRSSCTQPANCITGFLLTTDSTAQAGLLEFQTPTVAPPPPFSNLYVAGYYFYGTDEALDPASPVLEGGSFANPNGAHYYGIQSASYSANSVYCAISGNCTRLVTNETTGANGGYSVSSSGAMSLGGETAAVTNGNVIFYIDQSPQNSHPTVMVVEQ